MASHGSMDQPRLVLLCGLPGSGKTTLGQHLETAYSAVRLCPDDWLNDLAVDLNDEATRERLERRFWDLGQRLLELGQSVILESGFWLRSDRDEKRLGARALGAAVELRYLVVPIDEIHRRLATRTAAAEPGTVATSAEQIESWIPRFEPPDATELALFDSSAET